MKKRILLAEDDHAIIEVVKIILEQEQYIVITAESESDVKKHAHGTPPPDLILLDIRLSGSDGGNIAKMLKENKNTSHIPIVLVSANTETEEIAQSSGVNDFLLKPFDIDDLLRTVAKYCNNS